MRTKLLLFIVLPLAIAPVAVVAWYQWDSSENHGLEFGYYGDFNRVRHAFEALPGVTVTRGWSNCDVALEEFGFEVRTKSGQTIPLDFQEKDSVRDLSGERLIRALKDRIQIQSSPGTPPK